MKFQELLKAAGLTPQWMRGDGEITAVVEDSRQCKPGTCFVAVRGTYQDGHKYIRSALAAGAAAIVCQDASSVPEPSAVAVVDDTHEAVGRLAQAMYGWPARKLTAVAVTGTNGKTTVTHMIRSILAAEGFTPAMLGTIRYETGKRVIPATTTTPDPVGLAEMTAEMVAAGRTHLVMEASSHALDQHRMAGLDFRVGVFTNLTGDHLDYHKTMAEYLAAKRRLFERMSPQATAVVNRDDETAGEAMAKACRGRVIWYGLSPAADLRARIRRIDIEGTEFDIIHDGATVPARTPLIGRHNVFNFLAAAGAGLGLGIPLEKSVAALGKVDRVHGRLERVAVEAPYQVFVDYAHTDDALLNVLSALGPVKRSRLIVVFGCGGDRDRTKRPRMAAVAERLADRIVVTSDNPRSERPEGIIQEILAGLTEGGRAKTLVEADRRRAIELALAEAGDGDIVLIAGKGHEDYQVIGKERHHFDDREVAEAAMRRGKSKT